MKDPWRKTTREKVESFFELAIMLVSVIVCTLTFGYLFVGMTEKFKDESCAAHGMRSTQIRSWSGPVCRDGRGVIYDFGS